MKFFGIDFPDEYVIVNEHKYEFNWLNQRDWDFTDNQQGFEFEILMQELYSRLWDNNNMRSHYNPRQRRTAIRNIKQLPNIKSLMWPEQYTHASTDQNNSIIYLDRGKPDTIVNLSSGSWVNTVTRNLLEHQLGWTFDRLGDYNVISIIEDYSRTADNPILYDSCMYKGISYEIDTTTKLVEYIKNLIPNTNYHIVSDCKNGHSSCIIAHELGASRVLVQSGITHCHWESELTKFNRDFNNNLPHIYHWDDFIFQVLLRQMNFCKDMPEEFKSLNSIAEVTPDCEFTYAYCDGNTSMPQYIDSVYETTNVNKVSIAPTPYTFDNHFITMELEKSGWFANYFNNKY